MVETDGSGATTPRIRRDRYGRFQRSPPRDTDWTPEKRTIFLETLAMSSNVTRSVKAAGMALPGVYRLRDRDEGFRRAWAEALAEGYAQLELEMLRRARFGAEKTIFEGPERTQKLVIHSYADGYALRLLAQHRVSANLQRALASGLTPQNAEERSTAEGLAQLRAMLAEMREREGCGDDG
ncbi:hypothetical protein [Sphingomonas cavernae]|uniref:Terminase small subunit n=1 Tax=Sphingomonas cavernae TaxID=2320861 RepID=A0A418WL95_9SPHN|nr:hypothetical protein [Sphingomonas cavernae]RJF90775.1 hypothetical protein D3876_11310 [Sphingomonas cavernae]